jgi:hypothetical protein
MLLEKLALSSWNVDAQSVGAASRPTQHILPLKCQLQLFTVTLQQLQLA